MYRQHQKPGLASEVSAGFGLEQAVMWSVEPILRAVAYGSGKLPAGNGAAPAVLAAPLSAYTVAPDGAGTKVTGRSELACCPWTNGCLRTNC